MKRLKKEHIAVIIFIIIFAFGLAKYARADEARLGLSYAASHNNDWIGQDLYYQRGQWYFQAAYLGGDDILSDTWRASVGYRVDFRDGKRFSPFMRLGAAYFEEEPTAVISSNLTYDMAIGMRFFNILDLEWQHNSTASRSHTNRGNDMLLLGFVFQIGD